VLVDPGVCGESFREHSFQTTVWCLKQVAKTKRADLTVPSNSRDTSVLPTVSAVTVTFKWMFIEWPIDMWCEIEWTLIHGGFYCLRSFHFEIELGEEISFSIKFDLWTYFCVSEPLSVHSTFKCENQACIQWPNEFS
jgi:hypothetical protein